MRVIALASIMVLMAGCGYDCDVTQADWQDPALYDLIEAPPSLALPALDGHPDIALRGIEFVHGAATIHYEGTQAAARAGPGVEAAYRAFVENATTLTGGDIDDEVSTFMAATKNYALGVAPGEAPGDQYQQHEHQVAIDAALLIQRLGVSPDTRAVQADGWNVQFLGASKSVWLDAMLVEVDVFGNARALSEAGFEGDFEAYVRQRVAEQGWPAPDEMQFSAMVC